MAHKDYDMYNLCICSSGIQFKPRIICAKCGTLLYGFREGDLCPKCTSKEIDSLLISGFGGYN